MRPVESRMGWIGTKFLRAAESVAEPDGAAHDGIAPELRQVVDVVNVELRADEEMLLEIHLDSRAAVHLEMVRTAEVLAEVLAARDGGSRGAALVEFDVRAANAAFQLQQGLLRRDRSQNAIEIVQGDAVLQFDARDAGAGDLLLQHHVILFAGRELGFAADAEMLPQHQIAVNADREVLKGRRG